MHVRGVDVAVVLALTAVILSLSIMEASAAVCTVSKEQHAEWCLDRHEHGRL